MDMMQLMKERHSVRQYKKQPIEPSCFDSFMAHYGKFSGVENYIAIVGKKQDQEKAGYYGEELVLKCQELGLNTCWVAMTHGKTKAVIDKGEKLLIVLSLGYGTVPGVSHKSKSIAELSKADQPTDWFTTGMEAVCLAPTAMNQQKFLFELKNGKVSAKALGGFTQKLIWELRNIISKQLPVMRYSNAHERRYRGACL